MAQLLANPVITALIGGVVGSATGVFASFVLQRLADKRKLTLQLHEQFNADAMIRVRDQAEIILHKYQDRDFKYIRQNVPRSETACVWTLVNFFTRLAVATENGFVDKRLMAKLFSSTFAYWYYNFIRDKIDPLKSNEERYFSILDRAMRQTMGGVYRSDIERGQEFYRQNWSSDGQRGET